MARISACFRASAVVAVSNEYNHSMIGQQIGFRKNVTDTPVTLFHRG
jgi:hypothetical protein